MFYAVAVQLLYMIVGGIAMMTTSETDYDVAALANNLSQAFQYGIYSNDDIEEVIFVSFLARFS